MVMGLAKSQKQEERDSKGSRGSTNNRRRLDAFKKAAGSGEADWGGCNSEKLQGVVIAITSLGGAVTFGLSRNNGAYSVTIMLDGGRETLWYNGDADLDESLDEVNALLASMS